MVATRPLPKGFDLGLPLFSFDVVVIDPPWPWAARTANGYGKSPESHYSTMTMEEIGSLRVGDLLAPSGVLVMWGTWPMLEAQYQTFRGWGVAPKTGGVWAKRTESGKLRWGTGYVLRSVCEPFIVGTLPGAEIALGKVPNLFETLADASLDGLAREHSRKPDEFYSLVETLVPTGRRADIFARRRRAGWECVGNELDLFSEEDADV